MTEAARDTVLDRLVASLRERAAPLDGQARPAAVLWTDPGGEWEPLVDLLLARVEEAFVLGDYRPAKRTGPAVWLRCVVDGVIAEPRPPEGRPPIVYLPGVGRQELRAGADCPNRLKPLVELLFRGAWWRRPNGGDWTAAAFLTSPKALGLDVAGDRETAGALRRALPEVAVTPVAQLAGRRLAADDFDRMLAGDVVRDLLRWMGDPEGARGRLGENGWHAFCNRCREELDFDPAREADVAAGEKLAAGAGRWAAVWERFAEAPASYGDVEGLLRRSRPAGGAFRFDRDRWPDLNQEDEAAVREELAALPELPHAAACAAVAKLERRHGERRRWVWARLGRTPLAELLRPLAVLADAACRALGGTTPDDVAAAYLERGWQADLAAWETLAAAPAGDEKCVAAAVRCLLAPWLEESARAFQAALARAPLPGPGAQPTVTAADDECLLFVDGLRFDLAQRLAARLEGRDCRVEIGQRWAALPTVTATAKPAVTPVAEEIEGDALGPAFAARLKDGGRPADAANLRAALAARGYQLLDDGADAAGAPRTHPARGWLEAGAFDRRGHDLGAQIAGQLDGEIERLAVRIEKLLAAGWRTVRVVTDHGWLLLPGGLPKVDLPKHLTVSRWARCAVVAGEASPDTARFPWHWNRSQWFAVAPGSACFNKSDEYAHGGLTVQECLIPDLRVARATGTETAARIASVTWRGLRCVVAAEVRGGPVAADLRLERPGGASVAAAAKPVGPEGAASLVLAGDEHEEAALVLVLLDAAGRVLAQRPTRVGEDG